MAGAMAGVGVSLGLSCSTTKISQRRSSSSSSSSQSTARRCCVRMAISLDEKKKFTLQKSEEAFNAAKVQLPF
jgi:glutamate-1-semialdehyde 2,1-aminomutase